MKKILTIVCLMIVMAVTTSCKASPDVSGADDSSLLPEVSSGQSSAEEGSTTSNTTPVTNDDLVEPNESTEDYSWDPDEVIPVLLADGNIVTIDGVTGLSINNNVLTITSAGTYEISGSLSNGQIIVNTEENEIVRLVLKGVTIHNETGAAIFVEKADKVMIYLYEGSQNQLSDGSVYTLPDAESDEPNATLFSKSDLIIDGTGSLAVLSNYNDAISSKDGLIINNGTLSISSVDDGIRGKDYVVIHAGAISITASGDGIKSDEADDTSKGYIQIEDGSITINAAMDAIDAETAVTITGGEFNLTTGGGRGSSTYDDVSMKAIKGVSSIIISGGNFTINSADDAIHSNGEIIIYDGTFSITSGDDGIHSDVTLTIEGGQIAILQSYEGLESATITINGGGIAIVASDDGINIAGGADSSGMNPDMGQGGRNAGPGFDNFTNSSSGDYYLYINGGTVYVNASGDGLDSNGSIVITGGTTVVNGPTNNGNGPLDYMGTCTITGGILVAAGSSGMAQGPSSDSTQAGVLLNLNGTLSGGMTINVSTSSGESVFTFTPVKDIQSIAFSMPGLTVGETYTISYGGTASESSDLGLVLGGTYSDGTVYTSLTLSSVVTQVGSGGMFGGGGGGGRH